MDVNVQEHKYSEASSISETSERKHKKLRGKNLRKIKEQMEFYFSPANLRRDRFLGNLVRSSHHGYVCLDTFLTFNGIQKFTNDINDIIKAVEESDQLEIDLNNNRIRAKSQEDKNKSLNYDDCTIYVERFPQNADHRFVRNIFNQFGNITYVCLPKFKNSDKIKGFAFIEFEKPESAQQACEAYKFHDDSERESEDALVKDTKEKLNLKKNSEEFSLVKTKEGFCSKIAKKRKKSENEKTFDKISKVAVSKDDVSTTTESEETANQNKRSNKKRRKRKRYNSESEVIEKKQRKLLTESESNDSSEDHKVSQNRKRTVSESNVYTTDEKHSYKNEEENEQIPAKKMKLQGDDVVSVKEENEDSEVKNKMEISEDKSEKPKKRKRKKKDVEKMKLRVLSKAEWKYYKNRYLTLQRRTMSSVKRLLLLTKRQQAECEALLSKNKSDEQMNESLPKTTPDVVDTSRSKKEFQQGVIVKLSLTENVDVPSNLIKNIKSKVDVAFIDVCDKDQAFVRFTDPTAAAEALKNDALKPFGLAKLVTGDDELAYWEKLEKDRIAHMNRSRTNKRGRDKILAKASALKKQSTHIYFDDSF